MSLAMISSAEGNFQSTYEVVEDEFRNLHSGFMLCQDRLRALERYGVDFHGRQLSFNRDLDRRIGQLEVDVRNNRSYQELTRKKQTDQLDDLEQQKVAWISELEQLESRVKQLAKEREEKIVELKDVDDKSKSLIEQLEGQLTQVKARIYMQRNLAMVASVSLVVVGSYIGKLL